MWLFVNRWITFDHSTESVACCVLHGTDRASNEALDAWLNTVVELLSSSELEEYGEGPPADPLARSSEARPYVEPYLRKERGAYERDIAACLSALSDGESYELCLTNAADREFEGDPLALYLVQRRLNPAPYGAFLRFNGFSILSSSPERFIRISDCGEISVRPIKGTLPRGTSVREDAELADLLENDPKTRAENLMIVDLMRNDLGRICEAGSVDVPHLMRVEPYATVHQLVSEIRGKLRGGTSTVDAVRACFPAGSMTGAPKLRSIEILDDLEGGARGIYSGAFGYFASGGSSELAVTIRTSVVDDDGTFTCGGGGAIVISSSPRAEYEEMLLKVTSGMLAFAELGQTASLGRPTTNGRHDEALWPS
jgi:para-aminobenzoate synthetase